MYTNVSKGVLAKSKDLIAAFGTDDQTKVCLEVGINFSLRSLLASLFRDIKSFDRWFANTTFLWLDSGERRASSCW